MSSAVGQIDSAVGIVTPENIAFEYQIAGPLRRAPAYIIDVFIRVLVFFGLAYAVNFVFVFTWSMELLMVGQTVMLLMWIVLEWAYGGLLETFWNGQTLGKRVLGLRVLTVSGEPINGGQAFLRNFLRFADAMPLVPFVAFATIFGWDPFDLPDGAQILSAICPLPTFIVGVVTPAMNRRWQRMGDLAAGTMVVVEEPNWLYGLVRIQDPRVAALAQQLPPRIDIGRSTAKALAMYVERRRYFSPARRQEIAMHLGTPLIERYQLPPLADHDLLLCAIYWKVFVNESLELPDRDMQRWPQRGAAPVPDSVQIVTGPLLERRRQ